MCGVIGDMAFGEEFGEGEGERGVRGEEEMIIGRLRGGVERVVGANVLSESCAVWFDKEALTVRC